MIKFPSWVTPLVRFVLSLLLLFIGLSKWVDGYGMAITTIAVGLIVSELVGFGLSRPSAEETAALIQDAIKQLTTQYDPKPPPPP